MVTPRSRSDERSLGSASGSVLGAARSRPSSDRFDVLALWLREDEGDVELADDEGNEPVPSREPVPLEYSDPDPELLPDDEPYSAEELDDELDELPMERPLSERPVAPLPFEYEYVGEPQKRLRASSRYTSGIWPIGLSICKPIANSQQYCIVQLSCYVTLCM